ncbi:P2Y purinoceptor 8-like [Ambystoma mexicanum]|uniref:P2Y purinoceptor 8-like n=1 Tax=Ambystoma mexicanum TaxID=8296 RepID=UPI0037E8156B
MSINASTVKNLDNETLAMLQNGAITTILPWVYSFVAIISFPGNLFSLWLLCCRTKPKTPSVIFLINLSITDLTLACVLPFQIVYHVRKNNWTFGKNLCNLVTVLFYTNLYSSILTITCISIERYIGVVFPMAAPKWSKKRYAIATCLGIWVVLLIVLYPMESTDLTFEVKSLNIVTCFDVLKWDMLPNVESWAAFLITLFVFLFLIPFIVTVACYIGIIRELVKTSAIYGNGQKRRSIKLAVLVLLVFVTCFAPNNFILLIHMVSRLFYHKSYYHFYKLSLTISCFSSCLDPFIYYFASKEFRKKFMQVLGRTTSFDGAEIRSGSYFSSRSSRSMTGSSGNGDGLPSRNKPLLKRQESVF